MILVKLKGGLGNQMFQFAAAKVLAKRLNRPVHVDLVYLQSEAQGITKRAYSLELFSTNNVQCSGLKSHKALYRVTYPLLKRLHHTLILQEIDWVNVDTYRKFNRIILDGYFQELQPIEEEKDMLSSVFRFREGIDNVDTSLLKKVKQEQSVSIHIRRGDYVTNPENQKIYHQCSKAYYEKAIQVLQQKVDQPFFYFFSDDLQWAKEQFHLPGQSHFVEVNASNRDLVEFYLQASCKHNIIANSTFSWWAAYLNRNPEKTVIAPRLWFKDESRNNKALTLVPSRWFLL